jgi:hypothetical protein
MWHARGVGRSILGPLLLCGGIIACGDVGGGEYGSETAIVRSALVVPDQFFTDGSGDVKIVVRTCDYHPLSPAAATSGKHCVYCGLDDGWVMVGGGAEIEGSPSSARLRGSFPHPNSLVGPVSSPDTSDSNCVGNSPNRQDLTEGFTAWMARSNGTSPHRLRAYVVGLQIVGRSEGELKASRFIGDTTSSGLPQPSAEHPLWVPTIGGGADEVGSSSCFLTESRPLDDFSSWRGTAYCNPAGNLKVYSIALDTCLFVPGWDYCMQLVTRSAVTGPTSGYGTATRVTPYPWVTTSIGGKGVVNSSSSRFVADLLPMVGSNQGVTATTKAEGSSVSGTTTGYSVNIFGGRWGTWLFNSIRFNTAGTTLHRPTGTAPVQLRQSTAYPDAGPYRWYLESLGGGQFRVRNANPSQTAQGECAYRQTGTSNVLVGTCGSANEYKWTTLDDLQGSPFKLRNVASGTCLDNNSSTTNTVLALATCVSGYSPRQSLFIDHFSWPP